MRNFMDLLNEKYTEDNADLLRYLSDDSHDPGSIWWAICKWLEQNDYLEEVETWIGEEVPDAEALEEHDSSVFFKFPEEMQKEAYEGGMEYQLQADPASAPTKAHLTLEKPKLLNRTTWLIHFTDNPYDIAEKGFRIGMSDIDRLGLTSWYKDSSFEKKYGGYNFAFEASDGVIKQVGRQKKYGKHAVMFQNSGVKTYHYGDQERQVIFWGADVNPKDIIVLYNNYDDWEVKPRKNHPSRNSLYTGELPNAVDWVKQNYQQYRKWL